MEKKELKFIHITKCAGTFIEKIGFKNGYKWGYYHKEYGWWHEIFTNKSESLKSKYDWFVVVRNPYDRILSEYYCKWGGIGSKNIVHTKEEFNNYLIEKIQNRKKTGDHYTEQYKYIDKNSKITIIKLENLNEESTYSEFLGLELNTYIVGETYFLSPKLVGRTEKSKAIKDYVDKEWGFDKFERELSEFPNAVNLIESLKMWEKSGDHIIFDTKKINPSFAVKSSLRFLYIKYEKEWLEKLSKKKG